MRPRSDSWGRDYLSLGLNVEEEIEIFPGQLKILRIGWNVFVNLVSMKNDEKGD